MQNSPFEAMTTEYLIARSGIIGRQILRLYQIIHLDDPAGQNAGPTVTPAEKRFRDRTPRWLTVRFIRRLIDVAYTYYIGGSLTRSDQMTFARLHGMRSHAYRLTLYNALFCGIPCAIGYFLLGEGFSLLKSIHSYTELPSLLARHTSLTIGIISLVVDLFRAADAFWHRRCWAPFGFFPLMINLPTYLKHGLHLGLAPASNPEHHRITTPRKPDTRMRDTITYPRKS